jgi:predicted alpha/beta hydrolase family esterase
MGVKRQLLFVQGGGQGTHDEWDNKLVDSLQRGLGPDCELRYPRMPDEDAPNDDAWRPAIESELATLRDGAILVGHSVGGTILIKLLAEHPPAAGLAAIVLIAPPFVGDGGWPNDGRPFPPDLGAHLPKGVPVHLFHGLDDDIVPPSHVEHYARAIPQAHVHRLKGRDHQLNDDLNEVVAVISSLEHTP